jgi:hypothetical protein
MANLRFGFHIAALGLLLISNGCQTGRNNPAAQVISNETASRTIEDGGTGPYKALMTADSTLATHTIFRPQDLARSARKRSCRSSFGGMALAPTHRGSM